jgi:TPR repeat protein
MKRLPVLAAFIVLVTIATAPCRAERSGCITLQRGAEAGDPARETLYAAALQHGTCGFKTDKPAAAAWYSKAAEQGDRQAQAALAEMYFDGDGMPTDYPAAKKWYLKAAQQGDGPSQLRLAFLYAENHFKGVHVDYAEAEKWFLKAAEQDAGDARFRLGNFYINYKRPADYKNGEIWLTRAAEGGNRVAMFDLGRLLLDGDHVPRDEAQGRAWVIKSAEHDLLQAEMLLVTMYTKGENAPKDPAQALHWTLKIAAEPTASAYYLDRAGDALFEGAAGMPRNYPAARRYYERAAMHHDRHALARLAEIYAGGLGVDKDPAKAAEYKTKAGH